MTYTHCTNRINSLNINQHFYPIYSGAIMKFLMKWFNDFCTPTPYRITEHSETYQKIKTLFDLMGLPPEGDIKIIIHDQSSERKPPTIIVFHNPKSA
jgi:hypothetical protein